MQIGHGAIRGRGRAALLLLLALVGFAVSTYLASFQLGFIATVWDPLFGSGSERVLTSAVSRMLPVPDASLGAAAYGVDGLLAVALLVRPDGPAWLAAALTVVATVGAMTGLVLTLFQPLVARAFCSLCLVSAGVSVGLAIGAAGELGGRLDRRRTDHRSQGGFA
ncbi:MAG TPA: vitamin K epoxide reductase family protein [Candidatus Limnocylindrales bacterium]